MSRTFASLEVRNYRYYFFGALVSNIGTWIQRIAQDWIVLTELTDNSSTQLGVITALQFLAIPFLAPYAGAITDRFSKQKVLLITQLLLALLSVLLWAVVFFDVVQMWQMYALAFAQGVVAAFDSPARQAFVPEMVPAHLVTNAIGLNSTSFNAARLVGPGVAGLLIAATGAGTALLVNAVTFIAMLAALLLLHRDELTPAPRAKKAGASRGGLAYIKTKPDIILLLIIIFVLGTFGLNFQIYNAAMATTVFHKGATEFGLLGTVMAVGTLMGSLVSASRSQPRLKTILASLFVFSLSTIACAFAPHYLVYAVLLIPCGFFSLTVMTSCNAAVQLSSDPEFRGRVMSIYMAIFIGGTPIGAPMVGWLGDLFGPRVTIIVGGAINLALVIGVLVYFMVQRGMRFSLRYEKRIPHLDAVFPMAQNADSTQVYRRH